MRENEKRVAYLVETPSQQQINEDDVFSHVLLVSPCSKRYLIGPSFAWALRAQRMKMRNQELSRPTIIPIFRERG